MNIVFRILLAIYAFCLAIISAVALLITFEKSLLADIYLYINQNVLGNNSTRIIMMLISLVFFILSIVFLLSGFKSGKDKRAVSKHTDIGEIKISLGSIESIALRASKKVKGIHETKANVFKMDQNVSITVRMEVLPDVNIPALSEEMQSVVKKAVESSSGIMVSDVKVVVENISSQDSQKPVVDYISRT